MLGENILLLISNTMYWFLISIGVWAILTGIALGIHWFYIDHKIKDVFGKINKDPIKNHISEGYFRKGGLNTPEDLQACAAIVEPIRSKLAPKPLKRKKK